VLCARLQQLFLERPAAARLVHQQARACPLIKGRLARPPCRCPSASGRAQGYELALVPLVAARVPAARLAAPCLPELLAAPEPSDALFGVVLAAQLAVQHPGPATRVRTALRPALRWLMYGRTALHSDHRHGGAQAGAGAALQRACAAAAAGDVHFVQEALGTLAAVAAAVPALAADVAALCQVAKALCVVPPLCAAGHRMPRTHLRPRSQAAHTAHRGESGYAGSRASSQGRALQRSASDAVTLLYEGCTSGGQHAGLAGAAAAGV